MPEEAWKQWENEFINGEFPLLRYLGGTGRNAVFLTQRREGEQTLKAVIKLIPADPQGEVQLERWRLAADLSHPSLIQIFAMGRAQVCDSSVLYVVMERADENLAQILPERALDPVEARAILESLLDVLDYLHKSGLVHGRLKPANIMAIGEQLKVSSDALHRAGELPDAPAGSDPHDPPEYGGGDVPSGQATSPAGDIWSLGMTLAETLTRRLPDPRAPQLSLASRHLPEPFLDIVRHCLVQRPEARWTIADIAARLSDRAPTSVAPPVIPLAAPTQQPPPPPEYPPQPAQPAVRQPQLTLPRAFRAPKLPRYVPQVAFGLALGTALVLIVPRLFNHHSEVAQAPSAATPQPPTQPPQNQDLGKQPIAASGSKAFGEEESARSSAVPASAHPETSYQEKELANAKLPPSSMDSADRGRVARQVMPTILQSARNTIQGTVKVIIKVDVDREGNVEEAEIASSGNTKYFARRALEASQSWKFVPPKVAGMSTLSTWTLRFEFTTDGTNVVSTQDVP